MNKTNNIPTLRFPEFKGNWEMKKLGEMCDNISSGKDKPNDGNQFPVFGSMGIIGYSDKYAYQNKTILIARVGANAGALNIADGKFGVTDNTLVIKIDYSIDIYFLFYRLTFENLNKLVFGSGQPLITAGQLKNIEIPIPTLAEQEKIANFLTAVDEKIQALKKKKSLLENYKKGLMQKLFSQTLRFKDEHGKDFVDWEVKKGNKIFESISDKDHNSDLPILAISQEFGAVPRELINYQISVTDKSVESYKVVDIGDFIISLRSFQGGIEYSKYKGICSPAYVILRNTIPINHIFFKYYLKTDLYIQKLCEKLEGIRDGKMISYKYFSEIDLPYPSLAEQTKIANFLSSIDDKIDHCQTSIINYERWKKGLLQRLFV